MQSIMRLMVDMMVMMVSRSQTKPICADSDLTIQAGTTTAGTSEVVTLVEISRRH